MDGVSGIADGVLVPFGEFGPLDLLADHAHALYTDGWSARAVQVCEEWTPLADAIGDRATAYYLRYIRGVSLGELGRWHDAALAATDLLEQLGLGASRMWRAKGLALLAEASLQVGQVGVSLDALAEAFAIVEGNVPHTYTELSAAQAVGIALGSMFLYENGDDLLMAAAASPGSQGFVSVLTAQEAALLQANWGLTLELVGDPSTAREHYLACLSRTRRMVRAAEAVDDKEMQARGVAVEGFVMERLGEVGLAEARLREVLARYALREELTETQLARVALARVHCRRGEFDSARDHLHVAAQAAERSKRFVLRQACQAVLAEVDEQELGKHPAAARWREIARSSTERLWRERQSRFEALRDRIRVRHLAAETDRMGRVVLEDPLTGLGNRRLLEQHLERRRAPHPATDGSGPSVLFVDVDHFKRINDRHGHAIGDLVLCRIADILRAQCRSDDVVVRYGGDEFLILVGGDRADADLVARRIHQTVRDELWGHLRSGLAVTVSVGVAGAGTDGGVAAADQALYQAKHGGRDRVVVAVG